MTTIENKEDLHEYVSKILLSNDIRTDYIIESVNRDDINNLFLISGYNNEGKVFVCVNNHIYMLMRTNDNDIRYEIRLGESIRKPILRADIDFEGISSKTNKKATITCYKKGKSYQEELNLDSVFLDVFFNLELQFDDEKQSEEYDEEYLKMLEILHPCLEESMQILYSNTDSKELNKVGESS